MGRSSRLDGLLTALLSILLGVTTPAWALGGPTSRPDTTPPVVESPVGAVPAAVSASETATVSDTTPAPEAAPPVVESPPPPPPPPPNPALEHGHQARRERARDRAFEHRPRTPSRR